MKIKKDKVAQCALLFLVLLFPILSACSPFGYPFLESYDMTFDLADSGRVELREFDLGEGELQNGLGNPVPAPRNGLMALPEGEGPFPLVVFLHGVKAVGDVYTDDNHRGFNYLIHQLAAEGYAAMSINISVDYTDRYGESSAYEWAISLYEQHMEQLARANAGMDAGYGFDLENKLDLDRIHLVGHSRGGQIADKLARNQEILGLDSIKSVILLAPSEAIYLEGKPANIPYGIVVSELDTDVALGDGQKIFDDGKKDSNRNAPASLVFLRRANHAFFNRNFEEGTSRETTMTREEQEDFTMRYIASFLSVYEKGEEPFGTFRVDKPQPNTMFGYEATASFIAKERKPLVSPSLESLESSRVIGEGGASIAYVEQPNEEVFFQHPGSPFRLPLYDMRWERRDASAIFTLDADMVDSNALSLYLAVNPSISLNRRNQPQSFSILLKDGSGQEQGITIPRNTAALSYYPGEMVHIPGDEFFSSADFWNGLTPLGELRVPLSLFDQIDLENVTELQILFDQIDRGAIMLSDLLLQK